LPYPAAQGNLETEFKRIIVAWEKGQLINNHKSSDGNNAGRALIAWFVRLHSKIYKGEEFAAHDELEGEVLSHLAIELKERPLDSILSKIILINLAAEHFATVQMQGTLSRLDRNIPTNMSSSHSTREHHANVLHVSATQRQDLLRPSAGPSTGA
jgi:hypothetical protein